MLKPETKVEPSMFEKMIKLASVPVKDWNKEEEAKYNQECMAGHCIYLTMLDRGEIYG